MPTPLRQIHLDFHTSEHITEVGRDFDPAQFQRALRLGRVEAINVFAKCHHSWSYYPTRIGRPHPHLKTDLLGGMIRAAHEIGVQAPIYYTIGWSANDAADHPEWVGRHLDGRPLECQYDPQARPDAVKPGCSWLFLCPATGYRDLILAQTEELCRMYPVDGFWYDICACGPVCFCETCRAAMRAQGEDERDPQAAARQFERAWTALMRDCTQIIQRRHPGTVIYFNGTTGASAPEWKWRWNTRQELEDLPTTWGGYDKFPVRAKRFLPLGRDLIGMSGKFHTMWGEFGGFKPADAMRAEVAAMISFGARCCFGDQLHPHGRMDEETYRLIGEAYADADRIAPYALDGRPCSRLALWLGGGEPADQGVARMLLESQQDFEVVDQATDLSRYDTIILTGGPGRLDSVQAARVQAFLDQGGGVLAVGGHLLTPDHASFAINPGADAPQTSSSDCDYLVVGDTLAEGMVRSPILCYAPALRATPRAGTEVLARLQEPFFNRTYGHYCSHLNTPPCGALAAHPAALRHGRLIWLAHDLGALYHDHGARLHRQYLLNALALLYRNPVLRVTGMPSGGRVNLVHQPQHQRYVAHLLYAPPIQRGRCLVLEDYPPLHDLSVSLRVGETITSATMPLSGQGLPLTRDDGRVTARIPRMEGHTMAVFTYGGEAKLVLP